jgi:hypothetical protein
MTIVAAITKNVVETMLKSTKWPYMIDKDGDHLVRFAKEEKCPVLITYFMLRGTNKNVFNILILADEYDIPKHKWPQALVVCNEWNKNYRWPTMYLAYKDGDAHGHIFAEYHLDCSKGTNTEILKHLAESQIAGVTLFWNQIIENNKL